MTRDRVTMERLEILLDQARQESINAQATNQELQNEISRLKQKVSELQSRLYASHYDHITICILLFLYHHFIFTFPFTGRQNPQSLGSIRIKRRNIAGRLVSSVGRSPMRGSTVRERKNRVAGIVLRSLKDAHVYLSSLVLASHRMLFRS